MAKKTTFERGFIAHVSRLSEVPRETVRRILKNLTTDPGNNKVRRVRDAVEKINSQKAEAAKPAPAQKAGRA